MPRLAKFTHDRPRLIARRSIQTSDFRTTLSLEEEFWNALGEIALVRGVSRSTLVSEISAEPGAQGNLSSAVRLFVLDYFKTLTRSRSRRMRSSLSNTGAALRLAPDPSNPFRDR